MVLKGAAARRLKAKKLVDRVDRSLYVEFKNKNAVVEKARVAEIMEKAHPDVERVFLPRQKNFRYAYVLCNNESKRLDVLKTLKELNNEEIGRLVPKFPKKSRQQAKEKGEKVKRVMDPCCLLIDMIPRELKTEDVERAFPDAKKVDRFNERRCYIYFETAKHAMKARIRLAKEKLCGHKLNVKFNKIDKTEEEESSD